VQQIFSEMSNIDRYVGNRTWQAIQISVPFMAFIGD
jgi:hypothetical protein